MPTIMDEYLRRHSGSKAIYEKALGVFPSGITHDTRYVKPFPVYMTRGQGAKKWDVDGNEYTCYVMGHGALILGHSHPEIVKAVTAQLQRGTHLGGSTEMELQWAEAVRRLMPSIKMIRFVSSGTEAVMMSFRLARAFTKKNKILQFADHFHGWYDYVISDTGKYASAGIPAPARDSIIRLPSEDIAIVEDKLKSDDDIAGVIIEPTGASKGSMPLRQEFLAELREVTERRGVVLIFDEVVTGFRTSPGGAQERFKVRPDLTVLAKVLAGGLPGGAVGGRADIMERMSFHDDQVWNKTERVSHPGTFNANPLSAAAGSRCLELIATQPINESADRAAERLKSGMNRILRRASLSGFAFGLSSLVWVILGIDCDGEADYRALSHEQIKQALTSRKAETFKRAMLNEGVDIMGTGEFIVSAVHGDSDIDGTLASFESALDRMRAEGFL